MIRDLAVVIPAGITLAYLYETGGPTRVGAFLIAVSAAVLIAAVAYRAAVHTTTEGNPR